MIKKILMLAALTTPLAAFSETPEEIITTDIKSFTENAEGCDHLAEEFDEILPKADQQIIIKNVKTYCGKASRQRLLLKKKYKNNAEKIKILDQYESINHYRQ